MRRHPRMPTIAALLALAATPALAGDFAVDAPEVARGDWTLGTSLDRRHQGDGGLDGVSMFNASLGYGATDWLAVQAEGAWGKEAGAGRRFDGVVLSGTAVLATQDGAGLDLGVKLEYGISDDKGSPDGVAVKALARRDFGGLTLTANLALGREVGPGHDPKVQVAYAARLALHLSDLLGPAIETYGFLGPLGDALGRGGGREFYAGPVLGGGVGLGGGLTLGYEAGYLFGFGRDAADGAWKVGLGLTGSF